MPDADHFHGRSAVYRQLAVDSQNEWSAALFFDIANLFNQMAVEMRHLGSAPAQRPSRAPRVSGAFRVRR